VDGIDKVVFEGMGTLNPPSDPLEVCLLGNYDKRVEVRPSGEKEVYTQILNMAQPFPPQHHPRAILNVMVGPSKEDKKCTPKVELKSLPSHLRYEFLCSNDNFSIIVNASLDGTQIVKLATVLQKYTGALGYSVDDIKGINTSFCMNQVLFDDEHRPSR